MTEPIDPAAGDQYGLAPLRTDLRVPIVPPSGSENILPIDPKAYLGGTEFGGVGGIVQPPPHVPTASERRSQIMFIDPADDGTLPDSVIAPELDGNFT